jgi:Transglycosylase SLT domain
MRDFVGTRGLLRWARRVTRQRWLRRLRRTPVAWRLLIGVLLAAGVALAINGVYQVARKPTELFFPVSGVLAKTPQETWHEYGPAFRRYATPVVAPELLAALAQVEGSGNPLVRTYWRWSWAPRPFDLYRPASSAVGMYQITDGTFAEARHYCIHHHALMHEGPWNDWHSCWFNGLYLRIVPRDAIELTAAYLDLKVNAILANDRRRAASALQRQHLAAVVHLCGAGAAAAYAQRGFRFADGERCGAHDPREYLRRVDEMREVFSGLARAEGEGGAGADQ